MDRLGRQPNSLGDRRLGRPAVDRGDGVCLAGDMVAAPGCLSEIAWASAIEASRLAVVDAGAAAARRTPAAVAGA
jgi:hypothetical protein